MEQGVIYGALLLCSGTIWQTYWLWHTWGLRYVCTYFPLSHNLIYMRLQFCCKVSIWHLVKCWILWIWRVFACQAQKKNIINTVEYELLISWKDHMHYKLYVFAYYHRSLSEITKECRILYSRLHYSRICLKWFGISWGLKSTADVGNLQPISVCLDWMAVLKVFFFCCCFWLCLFFKSSPTQNLLIS